MSDLLSRLRAALMERYRIDGQIGEGGMATVFLAEDLKHARKVALKVLRPELAAVVGSERFLAEITTTASLQHPHILPLHDSGAADGFLYFVMPYVAGESLRETLDRVKQLSVEEAVPERARRKGAKGRTYASGTRMSVDGRKTQEASAVMIGSPMSLRSHRRSSAATVAVMGLAVFASCGTPPASDASALGTRVDAVFAEFTAEGSPGASVMVIRDGEVLHAAGYGLADLDARAPLGRSTPVRLGSVSKAFTAMAVVILEEQGQLGFDDQAVRWVPELARFDGVTVRHLLNHTSGLPDYYADSPLVGIATSADRVAPIQNAEAVSIYETWGEPRFPPGEQYEYSNPGYEVLALIVERVSGQTFAEFLNAQIFTPLGMTTASVRYLPETVILGRAIGYSPNEDGGGWQENDDHWGNWLMGAGGVYASLDDLYEWDQALHRWAESGERTTEAFAPAVLNDGSVSHYGFGWNLSDRLGRRAIHHGGGWVGFRTYLLRFPEERLTVIVLSNASAAAGDLADSTAEIFLLER